MFQTLKIYLGEKLDYKGFHQSLISLGYKNVRVVQERGVFSHKGSNVIIYPSTYELPIRIELDDDLVLSIRAFNPLTGDILEEHKMLIVLPANLSGFKNAKSLFLETIPISNFLDIEKGDFIVHITHGIGRFLGIKNLDGEDCFVCEYADKDKLYVPVGDMHLFQKYIGFQGRVPRLSKLGTKDWQKVKTKIKKSIANFAKDLLFLQAKRAVSKGFKFSKDTEWQDVLEKNFPYQETTDQIRAIDEVKRDMQASFPMNRLICGDVGFGKTEVALRASFKAVMNNKQVAVLVPTTILAEQHYRRFKSRLEQFPVIVEMLSRFKTEKEQKVIINDLAEGKIDIIIGTHKLLSNDIKFKDLGLLIIDEEQRFGVIQKEQFKKFRDIIDVLTLTATPIPRTLYMSLIGIRDISVINVPPAERLPIANFVMGYNDSEIKKAVKKELKRNGQVFFVHNRIRGIERIANKLKVLVPSARIAVAHGKMAEKELENIMIGFLDSRIDVLVSTCIIQSGIDIPNANTIIINRADMFGLADLYQLRGRVGRYNRKSYAYFLIPKNKLISSDAARRLKSIAKHNQLGSGFKIAMEDLEIRGAGNILGSEQHGFIQAIGFDLYCRLLRDAIYELTESGPRERMLEIPMNLPYSK
ncbi:MAG: transcription-repair coupling factor [Candidatus Saelkia tenebricola]|nr:transcription-repair coupling factor [Candidatus Saelkia tenebricola]